MSEKHQSCPYCGCPPPDVNEELLAALEECHRFFSTSPWDQEKRLREKLAEVLTKAKGESP